MQNSLIDLNNHLFAQLERLGDEDLNDDEFQKETERSKSIVIVATKVIDNARLMLDAHIARNNAVDELNIPGIILGEKVKPSEIAPSTPEKRRLIGAAK